jgi:thiol-disulfide isomerase/thioredoxin
VHYKEANQFYTKYLKPKIKDPKARIYVEEKIELLKHSLDAGNRAPAFSATSIHNQLINNKTLSGKNVLLIFWATWCGPCMKEIPDLKQINEEYKEDNLDMVSVSLDSDSLKMINVVSEKKLSWIQIFKSKSMRESFRINPIPAMFLIDEKGLIIFNSVSKESGQSIADLKSVLKQKFKH